MLSKFISRKSITCACMRTYAYGVYEKRFIISSLAAGIIAGVGAAASAGSAIAGGISSALANREARNRNWQSKAQELAEVRRQKHEDYADTAAGQNVIRQAREISQASTKQARGAQAVGGGTDAAVAQSKDAANKTVANTLAGVAANDTARKDAAGREERSAIRHYGNLDAQYESQRGQNIAAAAGAAANAVGSVGNIVANSFSGSQTKASVGSGHEMKKSHYDAATNKFIYDEED